MITDAMIEAVSIKLKPMFAKRMADGIARELIEAAIAAMWQPIETHKKGEERFLAYEKGHEPDVYECWWDDTVNEWQSDFWSGLEPSHWAPLFRPLPSLPEKSE